MKIKWKKNYLTKDSAKILFALFLLLLLACGLFGQVPDGTLREDEIIKYGRYYKRGN